MIIPIQSGSTVRFIDPSLSLFAIAALSNGPLSNGPVAISDVLEEIRNSEIVGDLSRRRLAERMFRSCQCHEDLRIHPPRNYTVVVPGDDEEKVPAPPMSVSAERPSEDHTVVIVVPGDNDDEVPALPAPSRGDVGRIEGRV